MRVNVADNLFNPPGVSVNPGDHVVWVWTAINGHTVTSGNPANQTPNGIFDSGGSPFGLPSTARFSWKAPSVLSTSYYCEPHAPGMAGTVTVTNSAVTISDLRITEVRFSDDHQNDFIEIENLGADDGNLGQYRVSVAAGAPLVLPGANINVPVGGKVVLRLGVNGSNTATTFYFPAVTLGRQGSAALYVPNTVQPALTVADMMVDYVQWGAAGQLNEATAQTAGLWTTGQFVDAVADGHSIEFCGLATERGATHWLGIASPNPGAEDCVTPTLGSSWGRVKVIYR